jgi:hypothetical protein
MSKDSDRFELEAIKDGFAALTRKPAPDDVPIPFTEKGCRRVGEIIARAAIEAVETPNPAEPSTTIQKPKAGSE